MRKCFVGALRQIDLCIFMTGYCVHRNPPMGAVMKRFLLSALLVASAVPALAADLSVKARPMPPPVPVWTWDGFYIGINGGYSWGRSRTTVDYFNTITGAPGSDRICFAVWAVAVVAISPGRPVGCRASLASSRVSRTFDDPEVVPRTAGISRTTR